MDDTAAEGISAESTPMGGLVADVALGNTPGDASVSDGRGAELTEARLDQKLKMAWQLFESVEAQVSMADRKVQAIFAANTLLIAAVSFQNQDIIPRVQSHGLSLTAAVSLTARLLLLVCVCASFLSAIVALFPRLRDSATRYRSLLFFGDIAALPGPQFVESFLDLPTADKVRQILHQAHNVSRVVAEKYKWTRRSGTALVLSVLLWIVVQVVTILAGV